MSTCNFFIKKYDNYKDISLSKEINLNIANKEGMKPLDYLDKDSKKNVMLELKNNVIKQNKEKNDFKIVKPKYQYLQHLEVFSIQFYLQFITY